MFAEEVAVVKMLCWDPRLGEVPQTSDPEWLFSNKSVILQPARRMKGLAAIRLSASFRSREVAGGMATPAGKMNGHTSLGSRDRGEKSSR